MTAHNPQFGINHSGNRTTVTVRKISFGHGVERVFPMHSGTIDKVEDLRTDLSGFKPGDTLKVHVKIKEGDKERVQVFEGICIKIARGHRPRLQYREPHE